MFELKRLVHNAFARDRVRLCEARGKHSVRHFPPETSPLLLQVDYRFSALHYHSTATMPLPATLM